MHPDLLEVYRKAERKPNPGGAGLDAVFTKIVRHHRGPVRTANQRHRENKQHIEQGKEPPHRELITIDELTTVIEDEPAESLCLVVNLFDKKKVVRGGNRAGGIHAINVTGALRPFAFLMEELGSYHDVTTFLEVAANHDVGEDGLLYIGDLDRFLRTGLVNDTFTMRREVYEKVAALTNKYKFLVDDLETRINRYNLTSEDLKDAFEEMREEVRSKDLLARIDAIEEHIRTSKYNVAQAEKEALRQIYFDNKIAYDKILTTKAFNDFDRTSQLYGPYLDLALQILEPHEFIFKGADRTDNTGDDKYTKQKHRVRNHIKVEYIITKGMQSPWADNQYNKYITMTLIERDLARHRNPHYITEEQMRKEGVPEEKIPIYRKLTDKAYQAVVGFEPDLKAYKEPDASGKSEATKIIEQLDLTKRQRKKGKIYDLKGLFGRTAL
ncbi:hypothetical protein JXA12_04415 [Candidatus Woesearchaeota archaeon]|nr:hypothetical protein [Candidatus Woesearchaeota archaeon]